MKFAILAAGSGSRLRDEGVATPKPLVPIAGVPLIERLVGLARDNGATEVWCIVNDGAPEVRRFLLGRAFGVPVRVLVRTTPSSLHSLHALCPELSGGPFVVLTTDAVCLADEFRRFVDAARGARDASGLLAVTEFVHDEKPLYVQMDGSDQILSFPEPPPPTRWVTGGLYSFSPKIIGDLDRAVRENVTALRNALRLLLRRGHRLEGHRFSRIVDVDHVSDIPLAEDLVAVEGR
jgi:NDP-sugar pyrophosphorylase family protein